MKPIQTTPADSQMEQAILDLDIVKLLKLAEPSFTDEQALAWALSHYESRPEELAARYSIMEDFASRASSEEEGPLALAETAYRLVKSLREELDKLDRTVSDLHEVLYIYRSLHVYLQVLTALDALCEGARSSRLTELQALLADIRAEKGFSVAQSVAAEIPKILSFPRHIYVGVNAREDGEATDIGVLHDDQDETSEPALLDLQSPGAASRCLFPDMKYTRATYGTHFEEYLLQHFEKHYHSEIVRAHKLAHGIRPIRAEELLEFEESLQYFVIALKMQALFQNAGYALCTPDPTGAHLASTALMYPDLALHMQNLEGKDIILTPGSSTLITGANHSGKTSYLKTIGQSYVLAQFGFPVPAASFSFRPYKKIYTLFATGEDSSMAVSRMGVEIQRLSLIMKEATADDLVLINEPMTSTNPIEAVSICCDLMQHFLDAKITHMVVTHLYDIYYLLQTRLDPQSKAHFKSLVTISRFSEEAGMVHSYRLMESAPLGNSYAMETAKSFQITLEDLLQDPALQAEAASYCRTAGTENLYEGGVSDGVSDEGA